MKKKLLIIILGAVVATNYSCQKSLLNPTSQTQVADQGGQPFSTAARIQSQVLALYANTRNGQYLGGRFQVYNDVKADNWINDSGNQITASNTWAANVNTTSTEVLNLWSQAYYTINLCNLFIDGMASTGTAVVGAATGANYVGEAKFLRAVAYYSLLQLYARPYADGNGAKPGLPLRLVGLSSYSDQSLAKSSVADVYAQIIKDLNDAETSLPLSYSTAINNTTRAHRNTAIAFKTRVYLTMGQYDKVITEANKIVSTTAPFTATTGVANALQANILNVFRTPYTTTESIFSVPFVLSTEQVGTQNALGYYYYANGSTAGNAEFHLNPAGVIADPNWKATDARRTNFVVASGLPANAGKYYLAKWNNIGNYLDYAPVMRYAEVLLNLAEARARLNGVDAQAIALLNAVRQRSDATTTFTAGGFANGTALVNTILQERNIEFLGEGLRNIDYMRTLGTIPAKSNIQAIAPSNPQYIWPISNDELLYNTLIGGSNN
ncbi:RagB/SusD family nutrient uptake outer membrane protein [Mucilaginibacter sp. KACC 22063]|uniref:RagB/SusD family nutrient uptake outer membrane protein n=1 Tax=Mucilaginibacter sp. KACC 22063 TaxID=3025666 RepID=UPI002366C19D|nr:RagB/SusD family nutrient uptake outer membrane protein [Mucilaginibacter sp. KACC 22063]WDF55267.1 RagB/SusD family nutrient uptake outer membrane protein [Mucilaginibacter sp. KACC 22063]